MNVAFTEKEASEHIRDIHKRLTGKDMESFNVPSWMIEGLVSGGLVIAFVRPLTPLMQDHIIRSRVQPETVASAPPVDLQASNSYEEFSREFTETNYSSARASMGYTWKPTL